MCEPLRLASGLRFPEGPTLLPDGRIAFVELYGGCISAWDPTTNRVDMVVEVGGAPNAVISGPSDTLYITQNGGKVGPWRAPVQRVASIQVVDAGRRVREFVTEVDGIRLQAPNDLVFGRDGLLYFTDPAEGYSPKSPTELGRIVAVDSRGRGRVVAETGPSFPNGIGATVDGSIYWVESYTRALKRYYDGVVSILSVVPQPSIPDGFKFDMEGNLYIAGCGSSGLDVIARDGTYRRFIRCGVNPVNCLFVGKTLYVTDGGHTGLATEPVRDAGSLWALEMDVAGPDPFAFSV